MDFQLWFIDCQIQSDESEEIEGVPGLPLGPVKGSEKQEASEPDAAQDTSTDAEVER